MAPPRLKLLTGSLPTFSTAIVLMMLMLPLAAIALVTSPADFIAGLKHPLVKPALILSLATTTVTLVFVTLFGTLMAWWLAGRTGWFASLVEQLLRLPVVVPPAVAGIGLLLAFGRRGLLGPSLESFGIVIPFTETAVILAQVFVAMPIYVQGAASAFRSLDQRMFDVARSLGAGPFMTLAKVAVPAAAPALVSAAALSWARALGEFGATLLFAGNLTGRTQTLPLVIYVSMETDPRVASSISLVLIAIAFFLLLFVTSGASQRTLQILGMRRGA